jgi:hypothetical protein
MRKTAIPYSIGVEKVVGKAFHVIFFQTHFSAGLSLGNRTPVKWSKYAITTPFYRSTASRWRVRFG